jgi:hypothetical protein
VFMRSAINCRARADHSARFPGAISFRIVLLTSGAVCGGECTKTPHFRKADAIRPTDSNKCKHYSSRKHVRTSRSADNYIQVG